MDVRGSGNAVIGGVAWSSAMVITRDPDDFVAQGTPVLTHCRRVPVRRLAIQRA